MSVHDLFKNGKVVEYRPQFADPVSLLNHWAKVDSVKKALIFDAGKGQQIASWTYGELAEQVVVLTDWLRSIERPTSTQQIDQVDEKSSQDITIDQSSNHLPPSLAFAFENAPEVILLNLAAWQAGWCSVPLDTTRDTTERKIYKLQQANCRLLFIRTGETKADELATIKKQLPNLKIVEVKSAQDLIRRADNKLATRHTELQGRHPGLDPGSSNSVNTPSSLSYQPPTTSQPESSNNSTTLPALILYTSGTTALPKGAVLTWSSLCTNAESIADWLHFTPNDRWLVVMPLHHINSTTFSLTTLISGATIVLVPKYSKSHFWSTLAKHACTGTSIVPTIAFDQLSETDAFDKNQAKLKQLTRMQLGSAPVQPSSVKQFVDRFGIKLVQGYGQTETSLRSTGVPFTNNDIGRQSTDILTKDSTADLTNQSATRSTDQDQDLNLPATNNQQYFWAVDSNTLGTELKYTNVTILDDQGNELPADEVGEICVRGPIIMQSYLNNPEATTEAFSHDWFHSGDTGFWQEHFGQKYFFLKGRSKEIIKKGGVLISPLAIENALLTHHPNLHQAYVIGFPDQRLGEQIGLIGVGEDGIVDHLIQAGKSGTLTGLEAYEFPVAGIQLKDDDLPKTSTGKIQRVELKNLYAGKLLEQYRTIAKISDSRRADSNLFDRHPELTDREKRAVTLNSFQGPVGKNRHTRHAENTPLDSHPELVSGSTRSADTPTQISYHQPNQPVTNHHTPPLIFRLLGPEESNLLDQAVTIDRQRWGKTLAGTKEQFIERATHRVLIGCVDENQNLLGTISALRINQSDLDHAGDPNHWTSTWDGVTGKGNLITNNHKGDSLLLVAVASVGSRHADKNPNNRHAETKSRHSEVSSRHSGLDPESSNSVKTSTSVSYHNPNQPSFDLAKILSYCQSTQDPVLSFHYTPKAGLADGAHFLKLLPNARPADHQALGFCVLVQYPTINQQPTINPTASIGTQLVEATLLFAYQNGIKKVFAYSRPVGLINHLNSKPT